MEFIYDGQNSVYRLVIRGKTIEMSIGEGAELALAIAWHGSDIFKRAIPHLKSMAVAMEYLESVRHVIDACERTKTHAPDCGLHGGCSPDCEQWKTKEVDNELET